MKVPKKAIILGKGGSREYAPYKTGEGVEIWAVNNAIFDRRCDKLFYLHYGEDTAEWDEMRIKAMEEDTIILSQEDSGDNIKRYPLREIIEKFGVFYFSNSISYMVAYALYLGVQEIEIYGVPLDTDTEYIYQKANLEFWLGYAMGQGMKVRIYDLGTGTLMKTQTGKQYGWDLKKKEIIPDWKEVAKKKDIFSFEKPVYERAD